MSQEPQHAQFFCQLSSFGSSLGNGSLRDGARTLLLLLPPDRATVEKLHYLFQENCPNATEVSIDCMFFSASPAQALYHLEVLYTLLMPALEPLSEKAFDFQLHFMISGEVQVFLDMLTKNNFMCNADMPTKRAAYLSVLKICKLAMTVIGNVLVRLNADNSPQEIGQPDGNNSSNLYNTHNHRSFISDNSFIVRQ